MNKRIAYAIVGAGILVVASAALFAAHFSSTTPTVAPTGKTFTVHMTATGFSPSEFSIGLGDTVIWQNDDTDWHWPASNLHPTHLLYPAFDPKEPVAGGSSWSFTFTKVGDWTFHDHLRPNRGGVVHVH